MAQYQEDGGQTFLKRWMFLADPVFPKVEHGKFWVFISNLFITR